MTITMECSDENTENIVGAVWNIQERDTIGRDLSILRTLLSLTQQQMADILLLNRMTLSRLENIKSPEQVPVEMGFRIYYLANEVMNNDGFSDFTRERATKLRSRVESEILIPGRKKLKSV